MIEVVSETVHAVMTIKAGHSIGRSMGGHERCIDLAVAGVTGLLVKCRDAIRMAILAGERFATRCELVSV